MGNAFYKNGRRQILLCCGCGISPPGAPGPPGLDGKDGADGKPGSPGRSGPDIVDIHPPIIPQVKLRFLQLFLEI